MGGGREGGGGGQGGKGRGRRGEEKKEEKSTALPISRARGQTLIQLAAKLTTVFLPKTCCMHKFINCHHLPSLL